MKLLKVDSYIIFVNSFHIFGYTFS